MKLNKKLAFMFFASLPLTAILAGCGGGGPAGPSATPSPSPLPVPTTCAEAGVVVIASDGASPAYNCTVENSRVKVSAEGYVQPREVAAVAGGTPVRIFRIPMGWDQEDVKHLRYSSISDEAVLYPLVKPDPTMVIVIVPAAGILEEYITKMAAAAAYMSGETGYVIRMVTPGETMTGKVVVGFVIDPAMRYLGSTSLGFSSLYPYVVQSGDIWVRPDAPDETYAHEIGHILGMGHLRKQRGLMDAGARTKALTPQERDTFLDGKNNRMAGNLYPDADPVPTAGVASRRDREIVFVCGPW